MSLIFRVTKEEIGIKHLSRIVVSRKNTCALFELSAELVAFFFFPGKPFYMKSD